MVLSEVLGVSDSVLQVDYLGVGCAFTKVSGHSGCASGGTVVVTVHHIVDFVIGKVKPVCEVLQEGDFRICTGVQN